MNRKVLAVGSMIGVYGVVLFAGLWRAQPKEVGAMQSISSTPSVIMAGMGSPIALGIPCNAGVASATSTAIFDDRSVNVGNSVYKCKLQSDGVTYNWVAPFVAATPSILGATASIGGGVLLLGGSVSGTATVTGATVGSNCIATRTDGTLLAVGMVIDCAVTAANTATVRVSALIAGTPAAGTYAVRVVQ